MPIYEMLTARFIESRQEENGRVILTNPSSDNTKIAAFQTFLCDKKQKDDLWPYPALDIHEAGQSDDILLQGICMNWPNGGAYAAINTDPIVRIEILRVLSLGEMPMFEVNGITNSESYYRFVAAIEGNKLKISGSDEINVA